MALMAPSSPPSAPPVRGSRMSQGTAEQWLITSAAVVAGTYAYMKWKGKTQTSVGTFATSWGVIFFILALVTETSPALGGSFSILVMTGDLLANTPALTSIVKDTQTASSSSKSAGSSTGTATNVTSAANAQQLNAPARTP